MRAGILHLHLGPVEEVANRVADEDLGCTGEGHDPGPDVDGDAAQMPLDHLALAEVHAAPHVQPELLSSGSNCRGGARPGCRLREGREEAVAGCVLLVPAVALQLAADYRAEAAQQVAPAPIAKLGGDPCRADDVQEEDGGEATRWPGTRHGESIALG
jgi:hypothetical protein